MSQKILFAAFDLEPGDRSDFDVDCTPWLTGTALMSGFTIAPEDVSCPIVFEAVTFFGNIAKFYASVPDGTLPGAFRCRVLLADNQGRTGSQWFQMAVT